MVIADEFRQVVVRPENSFRSSIRADVTQQFALRFSNETGMLTGRDVQRGRSSVM